MASRSSSRQTRHAFDPQRDLEGEGRGRSDWADDDADRDDGQPVTRILSSLDRLGERIRALSATRDGADDHPAYRPDPREGARPHRAPPPPPRRAAVREPSSAGIELQRAIEQIARKRDALDRGVDRLGRDAEPAARPRPTADRRDYETIDDVRGELRDLRRSVDRLGAEDHGRSLRGLGDRIDALARSSVDPRLVSALRDDVETLRDTVLSSVSTAPLKALEANYDDIVRRLEHMRGAIDNPRTVADLIQRLGDIRRLIGQVPTESHILGITDRLDALAQRLDAAPDGRALADMERQLASLATAVAGLDQSRAVETVENALSEVYAQLATIEKRLGGLDSIERWQENLDRQAALLSQLAQRTDQLPRVAHEMERQSASVDGLVRSVEALPRLASDLAAVRRTLDGEASQASRGYEQLVGRIDELAARLERTSPSADVLADPALGERLAEIASRLDRLDVRPGSADVAVLESHFARLAASLESRLSGAAVAPAMMVSADPAALPAGLMDALARIESHLASTTPYDRFAELESRVIDLTEALGSFERLAPTDVAGIERAITALRDEVSALAAPTTAGIE
jgi:localization factor PodJL